MKTFDYLEIASAIVPDRACLIFEGKRSTFAEVKERAERLAKGLGRLGLTKGDRIAFLQVNCPQCVETYYATAVIGAIFVPLNFRAKQEELEYMINHAGSKMLLVGERYHNLVKAIQPSLKSVDHFVAIDFKSPGFLSYESIFDSDGADSDGITVDDEDTTVLLYTSGTTGHPKGVPISHASFASYIMQNVEPASPDSTETNILTVPLYHVAGFQAMLAANYGGRTLALMRQFETREWLETVQKERANRAMLVPTMLKRVIDYEHFGRYDLSSLKVITYGSAPMTPEIITKAIKVMPEIRFINAFGQTETASTITMLDPEDHEITGSEEEKAKKLRRLGSSIGRPLPDVEIKIIDETGVELPAGEVGEIMARGPRVMSGYWNDPEKTAKAIDKEGWLHTSDLGYRDEDGYLYLGGRKDDLIIRGGENISPEEVENIINSHPAVDDVAVIGIPDAEWGEVPAAVVVLRTGQEVTGAEMMEFCREKLSSFKRPRCVYFVDTLPRNPMGKVLKKQLRETYGGKAS